MDNIEKLKNIFAEALGIKMSRVTDSLTYQGISEWDSISHMVLVSQIEDGFKISLDTDETIDLSSFVKAKEILKKRGIKF